MLRSVRFYSLGNDWPSSEQELSAKLAKAAFKPCGPYVERSSGFEPPVALQPELFADVLLHRDGPTSSASQPACPSARSRSMFAS